MWFGIVCKILLLKTIPSKCSIEKFHEKVALRKFRKSHGKISIPESPETAVQKFSREFCEIFKKNYFVEHIRTAASYILGYPCTLLIMHNSSKVRQIECVQCQAQNIVYYPAFGKARFTEFSFTLLCNLITSTPNFDKGPAAV